MNRWDALEAVGLAVVLAGCGLFVYAASRFSVEAALITGGVICLTLGPLIVLQAGRHGAAAVKPPVGGES